MGFIQIATIVHRSLIAIYQEIEDKKEVDKIAYISLDKRNMSEVEKVGRNTVSNQTGDLLPWDFLFEGIVHV